MIAGYPEHAVYIFATKSEGGTPTEAACRGNSGTIYIRHNLTPSFSEAKNRKDNMFNIQLKINEN
jgi:hypothetical protein